MTPVVASSVNWVEGTPPTATAHRADDRLCDDAHMVTQSRTVALHQLERGKAACADADHLVCWLWLSFGLQDL